MALEFAAAALEARKQWNILIPEGKLLIQNSIPSVTLKNEDRINSFSDMQGFNILSLHDPVLRKLRKDVLQEDMGYRK